MPARTTDGNTTTADRGRGARPARATPGAPAAAAPSDPPDVRRLVSGHYVALVGRLASMTREEFVDLVESYGGQVSQGADIGAGVGLIVVGQKDWLLSKDGLLPQALRRVRVMQRRGHAPLVVVSEDHFLTALKLDRHRQGIRRLYTTPTLCEVLGVAPGGIRSWVKAGLLRPAETRDGVWHFDFRQASAAKTLCDLVRSGVTLGRLRRSLEQLRTWLPEAEEPLQQLSLLEDGQVMVRLKDGELAEADGQLRLDFEHPASPAAALPPQMRLHAGPSSAADWYAQGVEQEAAGYVAEAVESYRQALLIGGPDADLCFSLANALVALGKRERAAERYAQAVELRPGFSDAWNNLGTVLAELGQLDEACAAFRRALEADPSDLRAHYNLADTLEELGFAAEAAPHWRAYLRYDRTSQWADHARAQLAVSG